MKRAKAMTVSLKFQLICGTVTLLLLLNLVEGVIGYVQFTRSFVAEYTESAFRTAETAAALVNTDHIQDYLATGGNSEEYQTSWARMNTLCQKQDVTLLYVIAVDTSDYGRFQSVFNTVNEKSGYTPWEVGYQRDTTNNQYREL